jgi:hypothetical protein
MTRGLEYLNEDDFDDLQKVEKIRHRPKDKSQIEKPKIKKEQPLIRPERKEKRGS